MKSIRLENIVKTFGDEVVLDEISLTIPEGKFFALLGPSGSGKSTILRLIAGFETPDAGKIFLGNEDITNVSPFKRRVNTVFQNYALFPHLNVFDNIAYSLRIQGVPEDELQERVFTFIKMMHLLGREYRSVNALSGGQRQRVALARALVGNPDVVLLDEPLAALDVKLKERMLVEFIELQYTLGMTFVYVTHDQSEALTVADTMAIMDFNGKMAQIGSPKDIYEYPQTKFVADFVGSTNLFEGKLQKNEQGLFVLDISSLGELFLGAIEESNWMIPGRMAYASIRPEKITISKQEREGFSSRLTGTVENTSYVGRATQYQIMLKNGQYVTVFAQNSQHIPDEVIEDDDTVILHFQKDNIVLLEQ